MKENEKNEGLRGIEATFVTCDPDNLPYMKLCICDIIRDLPELDAEDIAKFQDR